jgi:hypothetical protein
MCPVLTLGGCKARTAAISFQPRAEKWLDAAFNLETQIWCRAVRSTLVRNKHHEFGC